jgi:hypothetical protein
MLRTIQKDGDKIFGQFNGAAHITPKESAALGRYAEGVKAQGAFPTQPIELSSEDITLISDVARRASGVTTLDQKLDTVLARGMAPNGKWTLAAETNNRLVIVEKEVARQGKLLDAIAAKLDVKID